MQVNRERVMRVLESVSAGIAAKETLEQSNCFILQGGRIFTFDNQIACSTASPFEGIEGAVQAKPLLDYLRKVPEEEVTIENGEGQLTVKAKRKRANIRFEAEVRLQVDSISIPNEWIHLHEDFCEAVGVGCSCTKKGSIGDYTSWLHISPEFIEGSDNSQCVRYPIETGYKESIFVIGENAKHLAGLEITETSITNEWIHFRNASGLTFSIRRILGDEEYPPWGPFLETTGERVVFPSGLSESISRTEIFSSDNAEDNQLEVQLKNGKMKLIGRGIAGSAEEIRDVVYEGPPIRFVISPKMLLELDKKSNECSVIPYDEESNVAGRIKVDSEKFIYASALGVLE